ncbi:MAG TPA: IS110 family transposase [Candidatus Angelobacter sp.]|nr:IS110 family transposase [Candidatus Angelobacter sp.]
MKIIGCDFHPSFQQIAMLDLETGEYTRKKLQHASGEAVEFYRNLQSGTVRVGIEATGSTRWFERLLEELGQELVMGDAAKIRASCVRRQKTDARDADQLLQLLARDQFPAIWVPSAGERDLRELVLHRHKLVGMRTRVKNQLQHVALNEGLQKKRQLWTERGRQWLQELSLPPWTERRREDLLHFLDELNLKVGELDQAVAATAGGDARVRLLMTHPGVGPVTALAFVLVVGEVGRFRRSKNLTSYLGLIPSEQSSGTRRRLGAISKQGNTLVRTLLVEAGQSAARCDPELRRAYQRLCRKKQHTGTAKVMVARKLAVRLYWMLKTKQPYQPARMQSSPSHSVSAA